MRGKLLTVISVSCMISALIRVAYGYVRPVPKDGLQAVVDIPGIANLHGKNWFDTGGISYSQPDVTEKDIKIISYNVLGINKWYTNQICLKLFPS
jgi:hypothetical protein